MNITSTNAVSVDLDAGLALEAQVGNAEFKVRLVRLHVEPNICSRDVPGGVQLRKRSRGRLDNL